VLNVANGKRVANLSITHSFCREPHPENDVSQSGETTPHNGIAWRRVTLARKVAAEFGQLSGVVRWCR
jgi:hypothetical protein